MDRRMTGLLLAMLAAATAAGAHDRWEPVYGGRTDDDGSTLNYLHHGATQPRHDLHTEAFFEEDQDWFAVKVSAGHSYEARVNGGNTYWSTTCTVAACPRFDRVDAAGAVLTPGVISADDEPIVISRGSSGAQNAGRGMTVRWIAQGTDVGYLRALSDSYVLLGPETFYDVSFRDTTYFAPRWNNTGSQVSVVVVQNLKSTAVNGDISFFDADGTLLGSLPIALGPHALYILNTASAPGLAGQSGSASIAHLGGYGALAGKIVSLEPATGFTFDTAFTPLPY
ncbi:MAG: hypothetical protein ABW221_04240 [Vicinamibacteria bacterium]